MFLKYKKEPKVVNLDNFDYIEIQPNKYEKMGYLVVAVKLNSGVESISNGCGGGSSKYPSLVKYNIKNFETHQEAKDFFDMLQQAWTDGNVKVYEI